MIFIWGKRSYGSVQKVNNVSVKTVFGHLWYLPLFPMSSYYVEAKTDAAYKLNKIHWRSVLCGYLRVWMPVLCVLALVLFNSPALPKWLTALVAVVSGSAFGASYLLDKKYANAESDKVRRLMHSHFGIAVDPYHCADNLQRDIDDKMQAVLPEQLDHTWYKRTLHDSFTSPAHKELAVLRARCDQHDAALQQTALQRLSAAPAQRAGMA